MLQFLQQCTLLSNGQFELNHEKQRSILGFWSIEQTHQVLMSLQGLGLLTISQSHGGCWKGLVLVGVEKSINEAESSVKTPNTTETSNLDSSFEKRNLESIESVSASNVIEPERMTQAKTDSANEARMYNQNRGNPLGHLHQPKSTPIYSQNSLSSHALSKMDKSWEPSEQFHEMLRLHNIPVQFAKDQLPVFKQYYIDSGKTAMSWDSRFINWVQRAKASARTFEGQNEQTNRFNTDSGQNAKQRKEEVRQKLRDISDTSWAD
ncbi:DnaT-like ssDNA-binding domain-containing protein [Marinicellulosiphila megalodicopiae]|uniref:DnaT-like ssDNA-binding domain-containing protein n=1 Tax=Marinicellulosiphila megalodicopiae TaxID=2724896 RepID=UPI003BB0DCAC